MEPYNVKNTLHVHKVNANHYGGNNWTWTQIGLGFADGMITDCEQITFFLFCEIYTSIIFSF